MANVKLLNINSNGNRKLKNTDKVKFLIWNIPAVKTCPFRTEHCEKSCYARKAERLYPQVLPSREANYSESLSPEFVNNMIYTIAVEASKKSNKGKTIIVRIHESGDFYNEEYANKWLTIATQIGAIYSNVTFMAYTKSLPYFNGKCIPENMVVRASVWDDTKVERLEEIKENAYPIYTAFSKVEMPESINNGFTKCDCADCGNCGKCWDREIKKLACEIH